MNEIIMRFKSGREFRFKCEEYTIKTFKPTGTLSEFSYKGGVGECPIYYQIPDVECIAIIGKEQNNDELPTEETEDGYEAYSDMNKVNEFLSNNKHLSKRIKSLPPAKPKCGKWIDIETEINKNFGKHYFVCSECSRSASYFIGGSENWWNTEKPNYCPNCGARMEVEEC